MYFGAEPPPGGCEKFKCAEKGIICPNGFVFGVDGCQLGCGCGKNYIMVLHNGVI